MIVNCKVPSSEQSLNLQPCTPFAFMLHIIDCVYYLKVIDEEKYMENCHHVGTYLLHSLGKLRKKYEIVGDVRGKGLMIGLELVSDKVRYL